jgi:prepilin-type N-terminal cleavage/methylation domain-containing protein
MEKKMRKHIRTQHGFTLTEMAIVLGVAGMILSIIWVAAASVYDNFRTQRAATQVLSIVQNMKTLYGAGHGTLDPNGTDITSVAIAAGMMPGDMVQAGNTSYGLGPWAGSQVNVFSAAVWNGITVAFWDLGQTACNRLADAVAAGGVFPADGLVWEEVNSTARTLPPFGTDSPFTSRDVATACVSGSGNSVQITYSVN